MTIRITTTGDIFFGDTQHTRTEFFFSRFPFIFQPDNTSLQTTDNKELEDDRNGKRDTKRNGELETRIQSHALQPFVHHKEDIDRQGHENGEGVGQGRTIEGTIRLEDE